METKMEKYLKALKEGKTIEMYYNEGAFKGEGFISKKDNGFVYCYRHEAFSDPDRYGRRIKVSEDDNCFAVTLEQVTEILKAWMKRKANLRIQ